MIRFLHRCTELLNSILGDLLIGSEKSRYAVLCEVARELKDASPLFADSDVRLLVESAITCLEHGELDLAADQLADAIDQFEEFDEDGAKILRQKLFDVT